MKPSKNFYSCQECGTIHKKWAGKCPDCNAWNSLIEEYETGGFGAEAGSLSTNLLDSGFSVPEIWSEKEGH